MTVSVEAERIYQEYTDMYTETEMRGGEWGRCWQCNMDEYDGSWKLELLVQDYCTARKNNAQLI
jgi:hypothetical protein